MQHQLSNIVKPVTVPFFISHQGCRHSCIFCDQRSISGNDGALPTAAQICERIEQWRTTAGSRPIEVAFFGGTFTALPRTVQQQLLEPLAEYLHTGIVRSVRISTRPDCINTEQVEWLARRGVTTIELGVQSLDDTVLQTAGRGHTAQNSVHALRCIKECGVAVGAQLLPGLPGDTPQLALAAVDGAIDAGADFLRIYPAVVLPGTELAKRYQAGDYQPLSLEKGIRLCARLLQRALQQRVPVIRIGLQADTGLCDAVLVAGCWHPALGQLVRSRLYADLIEQVTVPGMKLTVHCHPARTADVIGMRREHILRQSRRDVHYTVTADATLPKDCITLDEAGRMITRSIVHDLHYSICEV